MKISIILPVYNENDNLPDLYERLLAVAKKENKYDFEFIFVDDGSSDESIGTLAKFSQEDSRVIVIGLSRNFGQQAAFTAGYDFCRGQAIVTMDSDLQDPPELISEMLRLWENSYKVVYARRRNRDDGFFKKTAASVYYRLLESSSDLKIPRNVGDFRLIDEKVLVGLKSCPEKFRYLRGMVVWLGFKSGFVDFDRQNRQKGLSNYTWKKMIKLGIDGLSGFTMLPLKLAAYVGLLVLLFTIMLSIYGVLEYLFKGITYPLYKWLINIIFGFMGVQFLLFWLLGEYVGRISDQVKDRPIYIVDKIINK